MLELYRRIKNLRISRGLSQQELADLTGYTSRSSIAKIEAGEVDLSQSKIEVFAKALNTTPAYLMGWEEYEKNVYGDHDKIIDYYSDNPELLEVYKYLTESESLKLLFDASKDLEPEDLETVLKIAKSLKDDNKI